MEMRRSIEAVTVTMCSHTDILKNKVDGELTDEKEICCFQKTPEWNQMELTKSAWTNTYIITNKIHKESAAQRLSVPPTTYAETNLRHQWEKQIG